MSMKSRLSVQWVGGVVCVTLLDSHILEEADIEQVGEQLSQLIDTTDRPRLLINFERVRRLSSMGLGMLVATQKRVRDRAGRLRLCNIDKPIFEIFKITRLNTLFEVYERTEDAVNGFDQAPTTPQARPAPPSN